MMEKRLGEASQSVGGGGAAALPKDLLPRAVSAGVLAAVALAGTWAGGIFFTLLVLAIAVIMSWEWSGIVRGGGVDVALVTHGVTVGTAVALAGAGFAGLGLAVTLAGAIGVALSSPRRHVWMSALGVVYVGLPAVSLVWLRGGDGHGAAAIVFIFAIVWTTDVFAYICGRMIGGPKLWPALSPRKTWAGTVGGLLFAALAGLALGLYLGNSGPCWLAGVALGLSILAQVGDFAESAVKRAYAVKDASSLIPGHGGFMDRMDGVVTAATAAALVAFVRGADAPGQSLLYWS
jgi:phosphatidate cytidylyltransferase